MRKIKSIPPAVHPDLSDLSVEALEKLRVDYLENGLYGNALIKKYNLKKVRPNLIKLRLPPIIDYDIVCPDCFVYAHKKLEMGNTGYDIPYCPICKRKLSDKGNRDLDCTQDTNSDTEYPGFFLDHMDDPQFFERLVNTPHVIKKIDEHKFPELTFEQKVFIGALAKFSIEEDMSTVVLLNATKRRISPQYHWLMNILKELNLGHFFFELSEKYAITIDRNITDYLFNPHDYFEASAEEILKFWEKLNYYEAAEYYLDKMEDVNFHTKIGAKTETILKALVSEFSIGQIWAIIHKSIQGGCEFFAKNGGDRAYATNSVIGACQRKADYYKSSEYRLIPYSRPWLVRRSDISYYFFDTLLGIGEKSTESLPSIKTIQALIS